MVRDIRLEIYIVRAVLGSTPVSFGVMNGSCVNVRFENAEVIGYGSSCTGIVAGYLGTNALECLIENVYVSGTVSGIQQVGGIGGIFLLKVLYGIVMQM